MNLCWNRSYRRTPSSGGIATMTGKQNLRNRYRIVSVKICQIKWKQKSATGWPRFFSESHFKRRSTNFLSPNLRIVVYQHVSGKFGRASPLLRQRNSVAHSRARSGCLFWTQTGRNIFHACRRALKIQNSVTKNIMQRLSRYTASEIVAAED